MTLVCRSATHEDVRRYYPTLTSSFKAWVAVLDGEVRGILGIALTRPIACMFSAFDEELRPYLKRLTILRFIKKAEAALNESRIPVWAIAEPTEPTAPAILKRLGFRPHEVAGEMIYERSPR